MTTASSPWSTTGDKTCIHGHLWAKTLYRNPRTLKRQCTECNRLEHFRRYWRGRSRVRGQVAA